MSLEISNLYPLLRWSQPILWMLLILHKSTVFDKLSKAYYLLYPLAIILFYPPWELRFSYPGYLLMFYASMWWLFTWRYSRHRSFTQALSFSALVVFVGSFYWEIPAMFTVTFRVGLHFELVYRVFHILTLLFLIRNVKLKVSMRMVTLLSIGIAFSCLVLVFYPDPEMVGWGLHRWLGDFNPWIHLFNRLVCVLALGIVFDEGLKNG